MSPIECRPPRPVVRVSSSLPWTVEPVADRALTNNSVRGGAPRVVTSNWRAPTFATSIVAKVCNWQDRCDPDGRVAVHGQGGWGGRREGRPYGGMAPRRCGHGTTAVSRPLYLLKAEFFKTLGHPVRIRVLELLSVREHAVSELLAAIEIEPANLSQQLAVLRRAGLVTTRKEGSAVHYSVTSPEVSALLAVARSILTGVLSGQVELLQDLRTS